MVKLSKAYFIQFDFRKGKTGSLVVPAMIGWSWTDVSVLGSQVFGQALMDSCAGDALKYPLLLNDQLINWPPPKLSFNTFIAKQWEFVN